MREILEKKGYRDYHHAKAEWHYQKSIRMGSRKLYFINVYKWSYQVEMGIEPLVRYSAEVRFYRDDNDHEGFSVEVHNVSDIEETEKFFRKTYTALHCVPDIHNN